MEEFVRFGILLDIYGKLLTDNQRDTLNLYVNEDLSLKEISELIGVTRQAAHDAIKKSKKQLEKYERALGVRKNSDYVIEELNNIKRILNNNDINIANKKIDLLIDRL